MTTIEQQIPKPRRPAGKSIGGPLRYAWREGTLTRAKELESLADWLGPRHPSGESVDELLEASSAGRLTTPPADAAPALTTPLP